MTNAFGNRPRITQARLKEMLHYDPINGTWKRLRGGRGFKVSDPVGTIHPQQGHRTITIDGLTYRSSHLAYLYMLGGHPAEQIDHRDLCPGNDRWKNLRPCTEAQNRRNTRAYKNNSTGFKGVCRHKDKWRAQIVFEYKAIHLGVFETAEAAHAAYAAMASELFHEFARAA